MPRFNILVGLLFLPFTGLVAKLMARLLPEDPGDRDRLARPRYLDPKAAITPAVALANVLLETVRMTELLERMFDTALDALRSGSIETLKQLKPMDERLNTYQTQLQAYLAELAQEQLTPEDSRRALELTLYISNLEHAGDVIQLNLADRIEAKARESISFTDGGDRLARQSLPHHPRQSEARHRRALLGRRRRRQAPHLAEGRLPRTPERGARQAFQASARAARARRCGAARSMST